MSPTAGSRATMRPVPFGGVRAGLCLLLFAATTGTVWWAGDRAKPDRPPSYSAAATIVHRQPAAARPDARENLSPADRDQIAGEITSDANLRRVLARLEPPAGTAQRPGDPVDRARRSLDVTVAETPTPGQLEITIACRGEDPERVVRLVNQLAAQYAEDERAAVEAAATGAWHNVHEQADQARQRLLAARDALDGFLRQHFQGHRNLAKAIDDAAAQSRAEKTAAADSAGKRPMIDNPQWVEIDQARQTLLDRRAEMLTTRTAEHPAIRDLDLKIAQLEHSMAGIPRQIRDDAEPSVVTHPMVDAPRMQPPPHAEGSRPAARDPSAVVGRVVPAEEAPDHGLAAQKYSALSAAADEAQESYDRLAEAELGAYQRRLEMPSVDLRLAPRCENATAGHGSSRLLLVALLSGLAMAAGVGMISAGLGADPPLQTMAEAQAALPVPVVGAVPFRGDSAGQAEPRTSGSRWLALWGLALVAICGLALLVYLS